MLSIPARTLVYRQGDRNSRIYRIEAGLIRLSQVQPDGRDVVIDVLGEGDVFGNLALASGFVADESAHALTDTELAALPLTELKRGKPEMQKQLMKAIAVRHERSRARLMSFVVDKVETRLIRVLLDLARRFDTRCAHGYTLEVKLTQQELADIVGATRQVVSSLLNELKRQGALDYTAEQVCLHDEALLPLLLSAK